MILHGVFLYKKFGVQTAILYGKVCLSLGEWKLSSGYSSLGDSSHNYNYTYIHNHIHNYYDHNHINDN
jgi:hypothetical protein